MNRYSWTERGGDVVVLDRDRIIAVIPNDEGFGPSREAKETADLIVSSLMMALAVQCIVNPPHFL